MTPAPEMQARIAQLEAQNAALADLLRRAQATGIWSDVYDAMECHKLRDDIAKMDAAPILDALRREAKLEALRAVRITSAFDGVDLPNDCVGFHQHTGFMSYRYIVDAAIAALEAENG